VRGENDRALLGLEFEQDFFHQFGVDGIEAGENFVEDQEVGRVHHGGDELNLLLHALR
jgi:hypothetical protein